MPEQSFASRSWGYAGRNSRFEVELSKIGSASRTTRAADRSLDQAFWPDIALRCDQLSVEVYAPIA